MSGNGMGEHESVRFTVLAEPSAGLLARVIQPFARRDLEPDSFSALRHGNVVRVDITMLRIPSEMMHLVAGNLRQIVGVYSVATAKMDTGMLLEYHEINTNLDIMSSEAQPKPDLRWKPV